MNKELLKTRDLFFAGKSALEKEQLNKILKQLNIYFEKIYTNDLFKNQKSLIPIVTDILASSFSGKLSSPLASKLNENNFYDFGNYLLQKLKSNKKEIDLLIHEYLNLIRVSEFLEKIYGDKKWEKLLKKLIVESNFTTYHLFSQRARDYKNKTLFKVLHGQTEINYSWETINNNINDYKKSFFTLLNFTNKPLVVFFTVNSLEMAQLDIACLNSGITNVMIPANSVTQNITYILNQTKAEYIFVSEEKQLAKIKTIKNSLKYLKKAVLIKGSSSEDWVLSFSEFLKLKNNYKKGTIENFEKKITTRSLASIMYTSGTTGVPKGIMFTNLNIVYKRFCRALALPKISDKDRFLAYLPLFHTFGRYLEMMGSIFWGTEYVFMENPSAETMLQNMKQVKPSIFISIPKKWIELYDSICEKVDIEIESEETIKKVVEETTGGNLKWGLSAAGFLPSEIFIFFQKYEIELMSGFGMTEATGGITMTPPGRYFPNSLGKELPGIEIKLEEDGELLIKGDYVMQGYFGESKSETFTKGGWLPTGDIMQMDKNGFIEIIDRKKEIYKNVKGETVAPQKIENYFRDIDSVKQVFLVGDHRLYNTVLIFPNFDEEESKLKEINDEQLQEFFSSVIVTVNKFLAPFERIIDFRIIDRPFSDEFGELTPKSTYKRRVIEKNFKELIETMYMQNYTNLKFKSIYIRIPNWFLLEKGILNRDIIIDKNGIKVPKLNLSLKVKSEDKQNKLFKIGNYTYKIKENFIDFQALLTTPTYWLGNQSLTDFTGNSIYQWYRTDYKFDKIEFVKPNEKPKINDTVRNRIKKTLKSSEVSLEGLHYSSMLLQSSSVIDNSLAVKYLNFVLDNEVEQNYNLAVELLKRPSLASKLNYRRKMFLLAASKINKISFNIYLDKYIEHDKNLFDDKLIKEFVKNARGKDKLEAIEKILEQVLNSEKRKKGFVNTPIPSLFKLLSNYGINHPISYLKIRQLFVKYQLLDSRKEINQIAQKERYSLRKGFRNWIGINQSVAVDPETFEEYSWQNIIITEEDIDTTDKKKIIKAISNTSILREAIFLISKGVRIGLNDILPGGIWISHLGTYHHKSVYRVSVQTRLHGAFDFVLNLNKNTPPKKIKEEVNWLILAGSGLAGQKLVEDFGGYWEELDMWSEEFITGDTVAKFYYRKTRKLEDKEKARLRNIWPFFVWNASASYYRFWKMSGYKIALSDPSAINIIISPHDYHIGTRIVSISTRTKTTSLVEFLNNLNKYFIQQTQSQYPFITKRKIWNYVFSGIISAEGSKKGLEILKIFETEQIKKFKAKNLKLIKKQLQEFIKKVESDGFIPTRLFFAIKRFHRWYELNRDASIQAQAEMLYDLTDTYRLADLEKDYPETRTRFFIKTAFAESDVKLQNYLNDIVKKQREKSITKDEYFSLLYAIQNDFELNEKEDFFLARLNYPYLKPSDSAAIIKTKLEGTILSNLEVELEDYDGIPFYIRKPTTPKEISRLHQLFISSNLLVNFRSDHQFLVAISDRGFIIGGLFYLTRDETTVHMEKIVVSSRYRRKGVSEGLMNELFNRVKSDGHKFVTTGFFHPEYFYRFGFKIEKKYSGLVKEII